MALAAGTLFMAGCEETAKKTAKAHIPASVPLPAPDSAQQALPLPMRPLQVLPLLDTRPALDILVAEVQTSYDDGQREYKAGNVESARSHFGHAVDLILRSGFQADSDPRLSDLFDRLGDAMQSAEMDASKSAEGEEAVTPSVPAAIDEIAEMALPAADPGLAARAEKELITVPHDLPLTVNEAVLQYLNFFSTPRGRAVVEHGLGRAGRYNDMIRRVLKEEGVPQDLIYLAQAESAFLPDAVSNKGARGIWQFMPFRGQEYDLERSYYIDERSDPEKATRAAAHHMRDLYAMFGDWYLVMAAYNSGPMNVVKAVQRTGYADYWELRKRHALPKQTQNYVPIIIALALVAKDPAVYGVQVDPEKPAQVETVKLEHPIDLHLVADATGADLEDLRALNPQLLRSVTPKDAQFELRLPTGSAQKFEENVQQVPEDKWTSWRLHEVESGETLADIARRYRVTVAAIEAANHLEPKASVPAGFLLDIPTAPPAVHLVSYRVVRGDTLAGIADRFDVTVPELKRWNHMQGEHVSRGMRLKIYAGGEPGGSSSRTKSRAAQNNGPAAGVQNVSNRHSVAAGGSQQHIVKPGETLYSIARSLKTSVTTLKQSNPFLAQRAIEAGDVLTVQP
jgi:membrane-bound lytic murein transglycosylase D